MRPAINKLSGKPMETQQMLEIGRNARKEDPVVLLVSVSLNKPSLLLDDKKNIVVCD